MHGRGCVCVAGGMHSRLGGMHSRWGACVVGGMQGGRCMAGGCV